MNGKTYILMIKKSKKVTFTKKKKKNMFIIADADVNKILVSKKEPMAKVA